jgi:hypothetical protein
LRAPHGCVLKSLDSRSFCGAVASNWDPPATPVHRPVMTNLRTLRRRLTARVPRGSADPLPHSLFGLTGLSSLFSIILVISFASDMGTSSIGHGTSPRVFSPLEQHGNVILINGLPVPSFPQHRCQGRINRKERGVHAIPLQDTGPVRACVPRAQSLFYEGRAVEIRSTIVKEAE